MSRPTRRFPRLTFHRGARRKEGRLLWPLCERWGHARKRCDSCELFLVRLCEDSFYKNRSRPCLQHQIKRCTAPCVGLVESDAYGQDIRHAVMFLEGKSDAVVDELVQRMGAAAKRLDYELAARYRDQIASLRRVQERQYVSTGNGNIDVVVAMSAEGLGVVQVFMIRDGQNLGNKTFSAAHRRGRRKPNCYRHSCHSSVRASRSDRTRGDPGQRHGQR